MERNAGFCPLFFFFFFFNPRRPSCTSYEFEMEFFKEREKEGGKRERDRVSGGVTEWVVRIVRSASSRTALSGAHVYDTP